MERRHLITLAILALVAALAVTPQAYADDLMVDDTTEVADEATDDTTAVESPSTETDLPEAKQPTDDMQGGTDKCVDPSACEPENKQPECTENCEPPEVCEVDCDEQPEPECVGAECEPGPPVLPEIDDPEPKEKGRTDTPGGGGNALPFTGIEDYFLPLAIGLLGLIAGFVAYRYAGLSDRLSRFLGEIADEGHGEATAHSAYADARKRLERDAA